MTDLIKLTPTLWCLPSRSMRYNAGVLASGSQAWLIDPGPHPDEIAEAADLAAGLGASLCCITLTHSHWDHILGPERLLDMAVVAHEHFEATLERDLAGAVAALTHWEECAGHRRREPFSPPPVYAAVRDEQRAELGRLELLLLHVPGHAADQMAIFEPRAGALWAADTLSNYEIPFVSHSLAAYETTLERLASLPIRVLVPGHGDPTQDPAAIRQRLDEDRAYLDELRVRIGRVIAAGGSVAEAVGACAVMAFRQPDENAGPHQLNIESVYIELGGAADPGLVGWAQKGMLDV